LKTILTYQGGTNVQNQRVVEFVSSKLKTGVDRETFLTGSSKSQVSLQQYNGYISRSLFHDSEHELWIDLVQWEDKEAAMTAAETFMQDTNATALIACLDQDTVVIHHFETQDNLRTTNESNTNDSAANCVEFLLYRLKAGTRREQYEHVMDEISKTMKEFPALIRRDVSYNAETEQWFEVIYYRDRASADAMFAEIKDVACMHACMKLLDETTLTMIFATPVALTN
jgi:antibiotic biosynthesis monooxygenase (ABM) superfamily enzyme